MSKNKNLLLVLTAISIFIFGSNLLLLISTQRITVYGMVQYLTFPLLMVFSLMYIYFQDASSKYKDIRFKQALKGAIRRKNFTMVYQPIISLEDESISLEALIRWKKKGDYVSPQQFISIIEEMGMMEELTRWIVLRVCKDFKTWKKHCSDIKRVSINITESSCTLDFLSYLNQIVEKEKISPNEICIEITENIQLNKEILAFMNECSRVGYTIAIDDFGTGYASLGYLMKYNFDILKIDRSFINGIENSTTKYEIAKVIVQLGKQLNMRIVAEGVENKEQYNLLKKLKVEKIQGYYISRPVEVNSWHSNELGNL